MRMPSIKRLPPDVVYRAQGDRNLLIEYGEPILDLNLRFRVQELLAWFERERPAGIIDLTPGIRSLQVHYDSGILSRDEAARTAGTRRSPNCPRSTT